MPIQDNPAGGLPASSSDQAFHLLFEHHPVPMWIYDLETLAFLAVNDAAVTRYGYSREEFLHMTIKDIRPADEVSLLLADVARQRPPLQRSEGWRHRLKDGALIDVEIHSHTLVFNGRQAVLVMAQDITSRKQAQEALRLTRFTVERLSEAVYWLDSDGRIVDVNETACSRLGYTREELLRMSVFDIDPDISVNDWYEAWPVLREKRTLAREWRHRARDGRLIPVEVTANYIEFDGRELNFTVARDITGLKQLEAEKEALAAQLYQAQKMEAIGRLAGGIAHDLNNLLVPIIGYAELGLLALAPDSPVYANFERIKEAGERAAGLTRQILAFSRQQVLEMTWLDLNQVVSDFEPMLKRLIGEDISLYTDLAVSLPAVRADKGQLEQALLNLVVNARDAMPRGGTLIIETDLVTLDEAYVARHPEARPGPHVVLAVSDTGHGMDPATQERIFEPFFTTRPQGQGSGLGLAMVFGIVKQHQGNIWVYSEPGQGATFKLYLPVTGAPGLDPAAYSLPAAPARAVETVLLVEDDASVRQLVVDVLQSHGYRVLAAGSAEVGLALAAAHADPIHLLLTDVILPGKNGRELYDSLAGQRPGLKVLFMSGYTDNVIAHHHVLDDRAAFLQKPFTMDELLHRVRAVLD